MDIKKFILPAILVTPSAANSNLILQNASTFSIHSNMTSIPPTEGQISATQTGNEFEFFSTGKIAGQVTSGHGEGYEASGSFFTFNIGVLPVSLSVPVIQNTGEYKLEVESGGQGTFITQSFIDWNIFSYIDSNEDDTYSEGELTDLIAGTRTTIYNSGSAIIVPYSETKHDLFDGTLILDPGKKYAIYNTVIHPWTGSVAFGNQPIISQEWDGSNQGHSLTLVTQTVPEPGTLVVLGLAGLAFMRRRQK